MLKFGNAPYLECSSRGERRFSAFHATINGKSIELLYQASKKFADNRTGLHWTTAKGMKPVNIEECRKYYSKLWDNYISEHPELQQLLINSSGLSDMFGQQGHACQAEELWRIRNDLIKKGYNDESN